MVFRRPLALVALSCALGADSALANTPGGGTNGPNVTLTDGGSTVTLANGTVSILCTKAGGTIDQINYTYNNSGTTTTSQLLAGGHNGGQLYWENSNNQGLTFTYAVVTDPANNGGNYAEIVLTTTTVANDMLEVHYSMLRGNTGFYVTPIWFHRSTDGAFDLGECRDNIYAGATFNWMSVDATRNRLMAVQSSAVSIPVFGAPAECTLWTNGIYQGQYEDKYKYTADFGQLRVWGWSSVGSGGKNVGLWDVAGSAEYYPGGPMKRELFEHIGTTILNVAHGSHFGGGTDSSFAAGEVWAHVFGPHLIYCNNITNSITDTNTTAQTLYADALAQATAEGGAWPYYWFTNSNYAPASSRGAVTGQILINDPYNPNAAASNLWVGLVQQPLTSEASYDFQKWCKPCQFWVKTDAGGSFMIPNVIAGANYTLYAFGPGAAGTFQSQAQSGGSAPNSLDIPASPFSVTVTAGATNNLGTATWTPTRVGPTVFEIGYPDRTAAKFRHGEDWWVGDIGPSPTNPAPVWSKFLEYPFDFPSGPTYAVGTSRWTTDWNFCQPIVTDAAGNYNGSTSTVTFNLASAPGATASLYLALSSDFQGPLIIKVNGTDIAGATGYFPAYSSSGDQSDATIREGIHGMFSDNRITFAGNLLHAGANTITINMRKGGYFSNHAMYDYLRLELTGYVPPPPASVSAYAGNNANLVCWPAVPGATSYNVLRSTTSGSGYVSTTNGVVGPVCGSGANNASFVDATAVNGTTYYYVVQSVNPVGTSANSPENPSGATPSGSLSTNAPAAPLGLTVGSAAHQSVTLNWTAAPGANFYSVYRSTLFNNGGGASNILGTIILANNVTNTSYTDTSPTDATIYRYFVTATSAGGTSTNSNFAVAVPLPAPPPGAPGSLLQSDADTTSVTLSWSAVSGAVGYVIRRATSSGGPFTFVMSITETTYTDTGLNSGATYYYQVLAVNGAGVSTNAAASATVLPAAPAGLTALPADSQVTLSWPAVTGATGYYLKRGTSSSNENVTVAANYSGTSYTNTGLLNGTNYFFVVAATNAGGLGPNSPEAAAIPGSSTNIVPRNLVWRGDSSANVWNVSGAADWVTNNVLTTFNNGDSATFDDTGSNNIAVVLSGPVQPSLVRFTASKSYTFGGSGSIAGTNALWKSGAGALTISASNTYSGGTSLSNGVVALSGPAAGAVTANNFALGSGAVSFFGGTLQLYGYNLADNASGFGSLTNDLVIATGQSGTILSGPRYTLGSRVTGGGTMNLNVDYVRDDIAGDWTGFTGALNVRNTTGTPPVSSSDDFRVATASGFPAARVSLGTNVFMYSRAAAGSVIPIGEFSATTNVSVAAGGGSSLGTQNAVTWRVGGLNTDATNAAAFQGTSALIKEGTGTWTLTGASTHSGTTIVSNGTLRVDGSFSSSPLTVWSGTLAGNGAFGGATAIQAGGQLAPGAAGIGALTFTNTLTLAGVTLMKISHTSLTNDVIVKSGALTYGGALQVTNLSGTLAANDTFQLFSAAGYSGSFSSVALPALGGGLLWDTGGLNSNGTIRVARTRPSFSAITLAGTNLVFSGSNGVTNATYYILATTNLTLSPTQWTRIATNQFDSAGRFSFTNAFEPATPQKYFMLQVP